MPVPTIHIVCRHPRPEFEPWLVELRAQAIVYSFATTRELLTALQLAKAENTYESLAPSGVIWLQSRPGEYSQAEIDAIAIADPLAKPFLIAGTLCEGEPRSGRLLLDVTRLYWHEPIGTIWSLLSPYKNQTKPNPFTGQWLAVHAHSWTDYQGLAGVCHSLGLKTIWQNDRSPPVSSEPNYRLFQGWPAWESWSEQSKTLAPADRALAILLLDFPRPSDFDRARQAGITAVLACPFHAPKLQHSLLSNPVRKQVQVRLPIAAQPLATYNRAG